MSSFFSSDGSFSLQFAIIFFVIFLALAGAVLAFRRFTGKGMALSTKAGARGRQPRLGIVDIYELDRQRQLILLRRDNVEHLLLVGGPNDVVIERNINRSIGARLPTEETADDEPAPGDAAAVTYAASSPQSVPYLEPTFEMPVVVPTPPPGSDAPTPRIGRPLDEAIMSPRYDDAPASQPAEAPASRRAASRLGGAIRRSPPSLVNLVPGVATTRSQPQDEAPASVVEAALPAVVSSTSSRVIDAAILSDMARQLEEAVRRPTALIRSEPPAGTEPDPLPMPVETSDEAPVRAAMTLVPEASDLRMNDPEPAPFGELPLHTEPAAEPAAVDPMAAAMATAAPLSDGLFDERDGDAEPVTRSEVPPVDAVNVEPEPVRVEPSPFAASPPEPVASTEPETPLPPAAEPEPRTQPISAAKPVSTTPNPFSVEEIEAEFARLLGRPLDRKN